MTNSDALTPEEIRAEYQRLDRLNKLVGRISRPFVAIAEGFVRWTDYFGRRAENFLAEHDSAHIGDCLSRSKPLLVGDMVSHFYEDETLCQDCAPTLADALSYLEAEKAMLMPEADPIDDVQRIEEGIAHLMALRDSGTDMTKKELWKA